MIYDISDCSYLTAVRERYFRHGAAFELTYATKVELGLTKNQHWTLENLSAIQGRIAQPLVLYW